MRPLGTPCLLHSATLQQNIKNHGIVVGFLPGFLRKGEGVTGTVE